MSDPRHDQDVALAEIALACAEDEERRLREHLTARDIGAWQVPFTVRSAAARVAEAREGLEIARAGELGRSVAELSARIDRTLALADVGGRLMSGVTDRSCRDEAADLCLGIQLRLGQALADERALIWP